MVSRDPALGPVGGLAPARPVTAAPPRLRPADLVHVTLVVVSALTSLFLLRYDEVAAFAVAAFISAWVMALAFYRSYRATGDAINVMGLSMLIMFLLYPFHGVVMVDSVHTMQRLGGDRFEYYTYGLLVAVPATWALYRGFVSGRPGRVARLVERLSWPIDDTSPIVERKLLVVIAGGVVARVVLVLGGTGTYVDLGAPADGASAHFLLTVLSGAGLIGGLYLLVTGARRRVRRRILVGVAVVLAEAIWGGLFSGSRYLFFVPLLSAVAAYSLAVRPLRLRRFAAILTLFVMVFFPLSTAYKAAYLSNIVDLQREGLSTSIVLSSLDATDLEQPLTDDWAEPLALRFHSLMSLALIMRYTPERHPFIYGRPYALLPLDILVPRVIWPDKPPLRQFALDFRFAYFQIERGSRTAIKTSQLGELWVNLHLFGVLVGSWVCGRLFRFMYSHLHLGGPGSAFGAAVYASALPSLVSMLEGDLATGLAYVVKSMVVWVAITWFLGRRRARAPAS